MITVPKRHGQTDRRTDRRTTYDRNTALCTKVHRAVKTNAIHEAIDDKRLDVFAVTETWHRSSDDPSLRLSAPPGYVTVDAVRESDPGHGGIAVFYRSQLTRAKIDLPRLSTFEGLCVPLPTVSLSLF